MLGLAEDDVAPDPARPPLWVDTGSEQLVIPLASADAVRRAAPRPDLMQIHGSNGTRAMAYVFAPERGSAGDPDDLQRAVARFFFPKHGAIVEDPGTGSACANLGGWLLATGAPLPQRIAIAQGDQVARPCRMRLEVTGDGRIRVSGRVIELGRGASRSRIGRAPARNRLLHVATDGASTAGVPCRVEENDAAAPRDARLRAASARVNADPGWEPSMPFCTTTAIRMLARRGRVCERARHWLPRTRCWDTTTRVICSPAPDSARRKPRSARSRR